MQIFVRTFGRTVAVDIDHRENTVHKLKCGIQASEGLPVEEQRLVFCGKHLSDRNRLYEYGLVHGSTVDLFLSLLGGKGGFGSNLRAAGKQKLTDNFDACRDLQGRRIRHKTAEDKLAEWQAEAHERELEKLALKHLKQVAKAEKKEQQAEVNVLEVRSELENALANVQHAVQDAFRSNGCEGAMEKLSKGAKFSIRPRKWHRVDAALLGDSEEESDRDTDDDEETQHLEEIDTSTGSPKAAVDPGHEASGIRSQSAVPPVVDATTAEVIESKARINTHIEGIEAAVPRVVEFPEIDLSGYGCAAELEVVGLEHLKVELQRRGLKCGGTLSQRAQRLFLLKGTPLTQLDRKHLAAYL